MADLDAILRACSPVDPVRLVGHSMGGNVACLYAGVRPARVGRLVALDAFGLADNPPENAPRPAEQAWLNDLERPAGFRRYPDRAALAARLQADNPASMPTRPFLAEHLGEPDGEGGIRLQAIRPIAA